MERESLEKPLISVVVPCYNHGRYLRDMVNSLIGGPTSIGDMAGQTLRSFEIIIVDDASTDNTQEYGLAVADPQKGIHYLRLTQNGGTANALNAGIFVAKGALFTTVSADDMREEESFQLLYEALLKNQHSFVYDNVTIVNEGRRIKAWKMEDYDLEKCANQNQVHAGIMVPMIAIKEVGGYPPQFARGREDWAINVALGLKKWCGVHIDYYGYLYRREGQNRTVNNVDPSSQAMFERQMKETFPQAYDRSVTSMCCGSNRTVNHQASNGSAAQEQQFLAGSEGTIIVEYIGGNFGLQTLYGPVTGSRYQFSVESNTIRIDTRDAYTPDRNGLLQLIDGMQPYFQIKAEPVLKDFSEKEEIKVEGLASEESKPKSVASEQSIDTRLSTILVEELPGIGKTMASRLSKSGIENAEQVMQADTEKLAEILGWSASRVEGFKKVVRGLLNAD